jgi:hypothetical protein
MVRVTFYTGAPDHVPDRPRQALASEPAGSAWRDDTHARAGIRSEARTPTAGQPGVGCTQFIATLVAVGFVALALLALFGANLAATITDRQAVKQALDAEALATEVMPALLTEIDWQRAGPAELLQIDPAAVEAAAGQLVSPEWMKAQAQRAVDAVFDYLESGDPAAAEVVIDMRPLLVRLRSQEGQAIVRAGLEALPPCPEPNPTSEAGGQSRLVFDCRPAGVPIEEVVRQVHQDVVTGVDEALAAGGMLHVPLVDPESLTPAQQADLQQIRRLYRLARYRAELLWLAPVGALALIALLVVRSLGDLGRWWGWPLTVAGGLALAAALLVLGWTWFSQSPLPASWVPPAGLGRFSQHLLTSLTRAWLRQVAIQAAVLLGLGMVLLGVGSIRRDEQREMSNE